MLQETKRLNALKFWCGYFKLTFWDTRFWKEFTSLCGWCTGSTIKTGHGWKKMHCIFILLTRRLLPKLYLCTTVNCTHTHKWIYSLHSNSHIFSHYYHHPWKNVSEWNALQLVFTILMWFLRRIVIFFCIFKEKNFVVSVFFYSEKSLESTAFSLNTHHHYRPTCLLAWLNFLSIRIASRIWMEDDKSSILCNNSCEKGRKMKKRIRRDIFLRRLWLAAVADVKKIAHWRKSHTLFTI